MDSTSTGWKFLDQKDGQIRSRHGSTTWTAGEWQHVSGPIRVCQNGFHSSAQIQQAFSYVQGSVLAQVEVQGDSDADEEQSKSAHRSMRIVRAYRWTKTDSVALAVYAAELVLEVFEEHFPGDDRPRKAIEAAQTWLENPSEENADAADAADAARAAARAADAAAYAAADAARAARAARAADAADAADAAYAAYAARAAYAAADAADAARAAAYAVDAAAYAAAYAVYAARDAAAAAAGDAAAAAAAAAAAGDAAAAAALVNDIEAWMTNRVASLRQITD